VGPFSANSTGRRDGAALAAEPGAAHGVRTRILAADLATPCGIGTVIEAVQGEDVGLLVAAAGFGSSGAFRSCDLDAELAMRDVNCRAVLALNHRFGQRVATRQRGAIVLFFSRVAFQGVPRAAHEAATKAWLQSLAEGIAPEPKARGMDVVAAAPGPVRSGFARRARMTIGATDSPAAVAHGMLAALGRRVTVRPAPLSKLLAWALAFMPRRDRVRMTGIIMSGMNWHSDGPKAGRTA
jgi:short-subunit dehydrogenase